jgi:hypothetical protein
MTRATLLRGTGTVALTVALAIAHFFYSWWFSMRFYELSGGIHKLPSGWTEFGGASYAWSIPLELPGAVMLRVCQLHTVSACNGTLVGELSMLLLLLASVVTAYFVASVLVALVTRRQISWGRWYWRAVVIILGLAWIPVREDFAPVFQYTVVF